jgi:hypothetical protein
MTMQGGNYVKYKTSITEVLHSGAVQNVLFFIDEII